MLYWLELCAGVVLGNPYQCCSQYQANNGGTEQTPLTTRDAQSVIRHDEVGYKVESDE